MWDWVNLNTIVIFGGLLVFAKLFDHAIHSLFVGLWARREQRDEQRKRRQRNENE